MFIIAHHEVDRVDIFVDRGIVRTIKVLCKGGFKIFWGEGANNVHT